MDAEHRETLVSPHYADIEPLSDPIPLARRSQSMRETLPDCSFSTDAPRDAVDTEPPPDSDFDARSTIPTPIDAHAIVDVGDDYQPRSTIVPPPPSRYPSAQRTRLPHRAVLVPEGWFEDADLSWSLYGE